MTKEIKLGVVEFHTPKNRELVSDFYACVDMLPGCIVDLWLLDIASVLAKHGYDMKVFKR